MSTSQVYLLVTVFDFKLQLSEKNYHFTSSEGKIVTKTKFDYKINTLADKLTWYIHNNTAILL